MTVSAIRTIVVRGPSPYGLSTPQPLRWPQAPPEGNLDYSLDLSIPMADAGDSIATASVCVAPSGAGEMVLQGVSVQGGFVTAQLSGGVAGRDYTAKFLVTTVSGRSFAYRCSILVDPTLASFPLSEPPSAGFGAPVSWASGISTFGASFIGVGSASSAGTNQATAAALPGQTTILTGGVAGGGLILSTQLISGTFRIINAWTSDVLIYPPPGAQIGMLAVNAPVVIGPNQTVDFSTTSPTSQWYAA